jgi:hypothetical protein
MTTIHDAFSDFPTSETLLVTIESADEARSVHRSLISESSLMLSSQRRTAVRSLRLRR